MSSYSYNLGNYSWKIKTASKTAQLWFGRGLIWSYGLHNEETQVCFERALREDPKCAVAYRGLAYIAGPNYNRPWETFGAREAKAMLTTCLENLTSTKKFSTQESLEAREVLEHTMGKFHCGAHLHPGLLHLYIHLMEMSPTPEAALPQADDFRHLLPDAGPLQHMSTHIDVLRENYLDVVTWKEQGIKADELYWKNAGGMKFSSLYQVHNYQFKLYSAMFLGQFLPAMEAARGLKDKVPEEFFPQKSPLIADWLESYIGAEIHALVRFGKWQMLLERELPEDQDLYCATTALSYYGKGIAHANLGDIGTAKDTQQLFEEAISRIPDTRYMHVVSCQDQMRVAREMLAGEIKYHAGKYDKAFDHVREAVKKEDALPYDEPWGWMIPSRHALDAFLLDQDYFEKAIDAYQPDLGLTNEVSRANRHPNNVCALLGLHRCYMATAQVNEARSIKPQLDIALARADKEFYASCFCAKS